MPWKRAPSCATGPLDKAYLRKAPSILAQPLVFRQTARAHVGTFRWRHGPVRFAQGRLRTPTRAIHSAATNVMSTGDGALSTCPLAVRRPVLGSIWKTTMSLDSWLATNRREPVGSI